MESPYRTVSLQLIEQTDSAYIVLAQDPNGNDKRAVLIRSELVEGMIFPNDTSFLRSIDTPIPSPTPGSTVSFTETPIPLPTPKPTASP